MLAGGSLPAPTKVPAVRQQAIKAAAGPSPRVAPYKAPGVEPGVSGKEKRFQQNRQFGPGPIKPYPGGEPDNRPRKIPSDGYNKTLKVGGAKVPVFAPLQGKNGDVAGNTYIRPGVHYAKEAGSRVLRNPRAKVGITGGIQAV